MVPRVSGAFWVFTGVTVCLASSKSGSIVGDSTSIFFVGLTVGEFVIG
jgi:hypothetical protein